ncbi:MAG: metallophosphoesterase [Sedimentisphaerales bacterium]
MNKIHPNRFYLEDYRKKHHRYAREGFGRGLFRVRTWSSVIEFILMVTGLEHRGLANAMNIRINETAVELDNLPDAFRNSRILFISDFHIELMANIVDKIIELIKNLEYDYCILGGDYSMFDILDMNKTKAGMKKIVEHLKPGRTYGIIGNHDYYEIAVFLESLGVTMLINENTAIEQNETTIYLAGVDDCYIFDAADIGRASAGIPMGAFKILLSHSPQIYKSAQKCGFNLLLSGHTHGGQICLPGGLPLFKSAKVPGKIAKGLWQYKTLIGFTSTGVGCCNVAARFASRPEIVILTLKTKKSEQTRPGGQV